MTKCTVVKVNPFSFSIFMRRYLVDLNPELRLEAGQDRMCDALLCEFRLRCLKGHQRCN